MLSSKILNYLTKELNSTSDQREVENRKEIINLLELSEGECFGLSALWVYGRRINDEPKTAELHQNDDIHFFMHIQELLMTWDGVSDFSMLDKREIERFISHVLLYQRSTLMKTDFESLYPVYEQTDLTSILEDQKRGKPKQTYDQDAVLSKDALVIRLQRIIHPKSMIITSVNLNDSRGHSLAIYQNASDDQIHLYDSNSGKEYKAKSLEELAELIWEHSDPTLFNSPLAGISASDILFRQLSFDIYQFNNDPEYNYPKSDELKLHFDEVCNLFIEKPYYARFIKYDKVFQQLVREMNVQYLFELFEEPLIKSEVKSKFILFLIKFDPPSYPLISRFLTRNCSSLMSELVKQGKLTSDQHKRIKKYASTTRFKIINNKVHTINEWMTAYNYNLLDKEDYQDLKLTNVLKILEVNPGNNILVNTLFEYCNRDVMYSHSFEIGIGSFLAVSANLKINNIETAKLILLKLGGNFNSGLSLSSLRALDNIELIEFMLLHFSDQYKDEKDGSELYNLLSELKNNHGFFGNGDDSKNISLTAYTVSHRKIPTTREVDPIENIPYELRGLRGRNCYLDITPDQAYEFIADKRLGSYVVLPGKEIGYIYIVYKRFGGVDDRHMIHGHYNNEGIQQILSQLNYPIADQYHKPMPDPAKITTPTVIHSPATTFDHRSLPERMSKDMVKVKANLDGYISALENRKYKGTHLFGGSNKQTKLAAARALSAVILGSADESCLKQHLKALQQGKLKSVYEEYCIAKESVQDHKYKSGNKGSP